MHSTTKMYMDQIHQGVSPPSWNSGDTFNQKARFIAATAWSFIKDRDDPQLPNCDITHQENLVGEVESIMMGNPPNPHSKFAMKVAELLANIPKEDLSK